jgi:hypothetical protein
VAWVVLNLKQNLIADTYCADGKDLHYVETIIAEALKSYDSGLIVNRR